MTAVWADGQEKWELLAPTGFGDEGTLHDLVEKTPDLLPLSGSPRLAVIGREVWLGGNKADLVAIEASGRLCIIEVKLAANGEARRAVVAQVLSYAAYLHGMTVEQAEGVLARPLARSGFGSLRGAAEQAGQDGSFDEEAFAGTLGDAFDKGAFRLVLVLDETPAELVRTVGFLQAVAPDLVIDLVTVTAYAVGDRRILVPQRIEPTRTGIERPSAPTGSSGLKGTSTPGVEDFLRSIVEAPVDQQPGLRRLAEWALDLEWQGLASLTSYQGARGEVTLLPKIKPDNVGLVTVWNWIGKPALTFWRTVFDRRAPGAIAGVEASIAPQKIGQGNNSAVLSDELLTALTAAYREASTSTGRPSM